MHIVIVGAGMPFGPNTLQHRSLGGSETAQLSLGKALAERGHKVIQFTNLPPAGRADALLAPPGGLLPPPALAEDGVFYAPFDKWQQYVISVPHDLLIISRDMRFAQVPHQAKHAVFWAHDLATHNFMVPALAAGGWNINEIWAVSEWHADQIHSVTGYPRKNIGVLENAIVKIGGLPKVARKDKTLIYAARPERGLEALLRPGGIMERLPDYHLKIAMYDHFPEHMRPLYEWCMSRAQEMPNVSFMGCLTPAQLRQEIAAASAYVYPTNFEETSCILARECMEQATPFLTNRVGALSETLGAYGTFLEDFLLLPRPSKAPPEWNSDPYCQSFAAMIARTPSRPEIASRCQALSDEMVGSGSLYWPARAEYIEEMLTSQTRRSFSLIKSLIEDGDAIAALHLIKNIEDQGVPLSQAETAYIKYVKNAYHFVDYGPEEMGLYYEAATKHWTEKYPDQHQSDPVHDGMWQMERHRAMVNLLVFSGVQSGNTVFEFGCAEGNLVLNLARYFTDVKFIACDFDRLALSKAKEYALRHKLHNVTLLDVEEASAILKQSPADFTICTEVLEHVRLPWKHLEMLEEHTKPLGKIFLSTPFGGWEAMQWSEFGHDFFRQHIWEFSEEDFKEMLGGKGDLEINQVSSYPGRDGRVRGHRVVAYAADQKPVKEIDLQRKIDAHHARQTVTACIITKDSAHTLPNLLNTLWKNVDAVHFAVGPCSDDTRRVIRDWAKKYPWIPVVARDVPAVKAGEFGFDDARNASTQDVDTDWFLWIDSDEYLTGDIRKYLRPNALDSYSVAQHHFTVDPRGAPAQVDRPARICRTGMSFFGKVHEHAELGYNGGPGYSALLPDIDIGHTGYVNEEVRRRRFERNFPLLEWDHALNPDRQLGYYLWFRDIIHRMRYAAEARNRQATISLALEAIDYYTKNVIDIIRFGAGAPTALAYFSEAMRLLGRGREVRQVIAIDQGQAELHGCVDDYRAQMGILVDHILVEEVKKTTSRYWG